MLTARKTQATPPSNTCPAVRSEAEVGIPAPGTGWPRGSSGGARAGRPRRGQEESWNDSADSTPASSTSRPRRLHMHVAMTLVFDPSTVPGRLLVRPDEGPIDAPDPPGPGVPPAPGGGAVPARATRCGWTTPTSTSTTTSAGRRAQPGGLRELADLAGDIAGRQLDRSRPLWEMWIVEGLADGQIGLRSPRCTTRPWTGCRGPPCSRCCSTSTPTRSPSPSRPSRPVDDRGCPRGWS